MTINNIQNNETDHYPQVLSVPVVQQQAGDNFAQEKPIIYLVRRELNIRVTWEV